METRTENNGIDPMLVLGKAVDMREILSEMDQIVVLKEGRVTSAGRYDELTDTSDELRTMMEMTEQRGDEMAE